MKKSLTTSGATQYNSMNMKESTILLVSIFQKYILYYIICKCIYEFLIYNRMAKAPEPFLSVPFHPGSLFLFHSHHMRRFCFYLKNVFRNLHKIFTFQDSLNQKKSFYEGVKKKSKSDIFFSGKLESALQNRGISWDIWIFQEKQSLCVLERYRDIVPSRVH